MSPEPSPSPPLEPSPSSPLVAVATSGAVRTLTLDSPRNRNALSTPLMDRLSRELSAAADDESVRVVVLSHTGPVFCSGIDLAESEAARRQGTMPAAGLADLLAQVWEFPKPVVARVGGPARAGGLGLIAAADIALCAEDATFAFTEVRLGVIPAVISATVLRRMDPRSAARLFLTGEVFDGARAARAGLVTEAVPAAELDGAVAQVCAALLRGAPAAVAGAKRLLRRQPPASVAEDLAELSALSVGYFHSDDAREGIAAFREKRDPRWVPADG
ncbi:MAG TPA: enoyl-CoA hydratase-related protein [Natronosporangium sp.]|nr:enoyl-CoA hydratase-related protein [Natronosporangium sp.]